MIVIIGGGHNALVAAFYLAKAGLKPLVCERADHLGGGAVTGEIHPGFHCPTLSHEILLHQRIVRDMDLSRHGLEWIGQEVEVCSLAPDAAPLVLHHDDRRSADSLQGAGAKDAAAHAAYRSAIRGIASVLGTLLESLPPDIDRPDAADLWGLLKAGRRFRSLGRRESYRLLRWGPMPVFDLVHECFDNELLRATIAAPALSGTMLGPRSAGSALLLLLREAHRHLAGGRPLRARGGPGAVTLALAAAAREAGAEIRTGANVERIVVRDGRAAGVVVNGDQLDAVRVVSSADPKTTFLTLMDPLDLAPDFAAKVRNYRAAGTVAKVNLALSALPSFGVETAALGGRIQVGPDLDYLERAFDHAKYGEFSAAPWLDMTIPSILDPSLAPAGGHVASIYVHYAPYHLRAGDWDSARSHLLTATLAALERHAPDVRSAIVAAQVITPAELAGIHGMAGGHIFHGELALDQLFAMRPLLGYARYTTPIQGLYLCGGGTHPGGFMTGTSGRLAAETVRAARQIQPAERLRP
jgi:phytoene dehydrogenase-like protein